MEKKNIEKEEMKDDKKKGKHGIFKKMAIRFVYFVTQTINILSICCIYE